jgi:hypothetical protein
VDCHEVPSILSSEPQSSACERLAAAKPGCVCESYSVEPTLSPGVVDSQETLARFVLPQDLDGTGNVVKPSLFSHAGTNGMSVTRAERAGKEGLIKQQQTRNYVGYVDTSCRAIRGIMSDDVRAFCVYDAAQTDNPAHADVCQAIFRSRSVASQLRRELMLTFGRTPKSAAE